ncbi:MAG: hypothetical protein AUI14_04110 [Actinobacteria bacterium 13_2_20CM_2_71_6]|nr:MAG: hypothetical protein AUI14_04110 [Actinobacteria bacterium 13_2_20CM_2_71_6]
MTRHEVSRWEREERVPTGFWLGWLALVLDVPLDALAAAAARTRRRRPAVRTPNGINPTLADRPAPGRWRPHASHARP